MLEPKPENMDGDRFLTWLWKVSQAIEARAASLGPCQDGRDWAVAAFNCNYDPQAAAYDWLRRQLDTNSPVVERRAA